VQSNRTGVYRQRCSEPAFPDPDSFNQGSKLRFTLTTPLAVLKLLILPTRLPSHVFFGKPTVMAVYFTLKTSLRRTLFATMLCPALAIMSAQDAFCQDPIVDRLDPTNLRPGEKASVVVSGKQLIGAVSLWTPVGTFRPKADSDLTKDLPVTMEGDVRADAVPGIYPARMVTNHGCSEAAWIIVDDLPGIALAPESEDRKSGQLIALPCSVSGQMKPVLSKFFRVALTSGQTLTAEVFARRLGSDMDPVLIVTGPNGSEIAYRDDFPGGEGDCQLQFTAAADGEHRIEVRDVRYTGGARHFFHLRLGKFPLTSSTSARIVQSGHNVSFVDPAGQLLGEASASPDAAGFIPVSFKSPDADASILTSVLLTSETVQSESEPNNSRPEATALQSGSLILTGTLQEKGDVDWFKISTAEAAPLLVSARTREVNSPTDVLLELYNSEGGKMVENDDAGPRDAELAAQLPAAGDFFLKVSEIAGRGGPEWTYALEVFLNRKAIRITAPVDRLNVPRGGSAGVALTVRRIHYDGPLKVEAVGLPAAVKMAPFTIGAKQSTVPAVLTAADPAATSSDADWAAMTFRFTAPDGVAIPTAELQLAPPPPKKADAEIFRSARIRADFFTAVQPSAQFSMLPDPAAVTVVQGATATVTVRSVRAAEWTMPIEIALATPADQLPAGITVTGGSMAAGELPVTITAAADAAPGFFTLFLQGKAKKDAVEPVHPVPPIVVEIKAP